MSLKDIYSAKEERDEASFERKMPVLSFEVFPPKDDVDGTKLEKLIGHLKVLKKYNPAFISLTYGAGGTTQSSSLNIIKKIKSEVGVDVTPHFTCVNSSRDNVKLYLDAIEALGIENILALRGDIPQGVTQDNFDFKYANELVEFIKSKSKLSIAVAGYPEGHIECGDFRLDLENLKRKVEQGADVILTQLFFDNEKYFSFVQSARNIGINIPIVPGILPIISFPQLEKMLSMAKVAVPKAFMSKLEKYKDDHSAIKEIGIEFASQQCQHLISSGVPGIHFYTLNKSYSVGKVLDNLGF